MQNSQAARITTRLGGVSMREDDHHPGAAGLPEAVHKPCTQGKLDIPDALEAGARHASLPALPITVAYALVAGRLPRHYGDPFDRMLITQAQLPQLTVVTHDPRIQPYGVPILCT